MQLKRLTSLIQNFREVDAKMKRFLPARRVQVVKHELVAAGQHSVLELLRGVFGRCCFIGRPALTQSRRSRIIGSDAFFYTLIEASNLS